MRRLDHARSAMRAGQSLAETALDSGFADQSHTTRQFKRAYGLSPGRWRAIEAAAKGGMDGPTPHVPDGLHTLKDPRLSALRQAGRPWSSEEYTSEPQSLMRPP